MTKAELLNSLIDTHEQTHHVDSNGEKFTIDYWYSYCSKCDSLVCAEDSDEWIFRIFACDCRNEEETEALVWKRVEAKDDDRQEEFWEREQEMLKQAEDRWSEGWIA